MLLTSIIEFPEQKPYTTYIFNKHDELVKWYPPIFFLRLNDRAKRTSKTGNGRRVFTKPNNKVWQQDFC